MTFASAFEAVGGLLLIGSLGLSIHVTVSGKKVKTWTPFVWSGLLGVLIVVSEVATAGDPVSRSLAEPVGMILNAIGGLSPVPSK